MRSVYHGYQFLGEMLKTILTNFSVKVVNAVLKLIN